MIDSFCTIAPYCDMYFIYAVSLTRINMGKDYKENRFMLKSTLIQEIWGFIWENRRAPKIWSLPDNLGELSGKIRFAKAWLNVGIFLDFAHKYNAWFDIWNRQWKSYALVHCRDSNLFWRKIGSLSLESLSVLKLESQPCSLSAFFGAAKWSNTAGQPYESLSAQHTSVFNEGTGQDIYNIGHKSVIRKI